MLRINRIRIEIATEKGLCGFDTELNHGLNFLTSQENTCGKSSILAAIYYCLGLEEILGGRTEKVLTSVYKSQIEVDNMLFSVLESATYLEISNGIEEITLLRTAKRNGRDSHMITIFFSTYSEIYNADTKKKDTYVNQPNAATNEAGFHKFLEDFLHLNLPMVQATDNSQRKLYLQLIFSCMFIEQKHGWSDLFSGMPILGIKESKKKVIEYVLNLDTLANERKREQLISDKKSIELEWKQWRSDLCLIIRGCQGQIVNFPENPQIMKAEAIDSIAIMIEEDTIDDRIKRLNEDLSSMSRLKPKVMDNFDDLQEELVQTEDECQSVSDYIAKCKHELYAVQHRIRSISKDVEVIKTDLSNNKDAAKLQRLGSSLGLQIAENKCPVCHQKIQDSLLPGINDVPVMSVEENIKHLEAQLKMMEFALSSHKTREFELQNVIEHAQARLTSLTRLAQLVRSDLYSVNDDLSESIIYKRIETEMEIKKLSDIKRDLESCKAHIRDLVRKWKVYREEEEKLPPKGKTKTDRKKLDMLRKKYIENLHRYGYKSVPDLELVTISEETYLPLYEGFDMKFDSSASDGIRVIWAFSMALLQVSIEMQGNHPGLLIFDEPDQQSTMIGDMKAFFDTIVEINDSSQVIVAITLKDKDTVEAVDEIKKEDKFCIPVQNKAFQWLE